MQVWILSLALVEQKLGMMMVKLPSFRPEITENLVVLQKAISSTGFQAPLSAQFIPIWRRITCGLKTL